MNKEYVQQYAQLERAHWWFLVRGKIILQFLKRHLPVQAVLPIKVLNIGAAAGASSELLHVFGDVVSVETDPLFIQYLQEQHISVIRASITKLPFNDNSFDLVCAFDVIEHVASDAAAITEMQRVCKPGGSLCITVPAFKSLWSKHDVVNGHFRRYTRSSLRSLFQKHSGLQPIQTSYFNSLLFLPIAAARKSSNLAGKTHRGQQSDFTYFKTPAFVNNILKWIFGLELSLIKSVNFPFGVSLISFLKKK